MPMVTAPKLHQISEAKDPKQGILDAIGDISGLELCGDWVLLGTHIGPNKQGSIYLPDKSVGEDEFQSKCGLILKMGPLAFQYEDYSGPDFKVGDWVVFALGDTLAATINGVPCRRIRDERIAMKVADPSMVR